MREKTMVIISNPEHPLYKSRGKVVEQGLFQDELDDRVAVWLMEEEELRFFNQSDLKASGSSKNLRTPHSRKEFYTFIHDARTKKNDIVEVINMMAHKGKMNFKEPEHSQDGESYSLENLISFIENSTTSKSDVVEEIRTKRDAGLMEFNLPNNNISAQSQNNNKNSKKKTYRKKSSKRKPSNSKKKA